MFRDYQFTIDQLTIAGVSREQLNIQHSKLNIAHSGYPPKTYVPYFMAISVVQLPSNSLPVRFRVWILINSRRRQLNVWKVTSNTLNFLMKRKRNRKRTMSIGLMWLWRVLNKGCVIVTNCMNKQGIINVQLMFN